MESSCECMNGDAALINYVLYVKVKDRIYYCEKGINQNCFRAWIWELLSNKHWARKEILSLLSYLCMNVCI